MKLVAIVDLETSSADPTSCAILEIAVCLWSVEHRTRIQTYSTLVFAEENPAANVNHIPPEALHLAPRFDSAFKSIGFFVNKADAIAAHNGEDFDRLVLERYRCPWAASKPWIDTMDLDWPRESSKSLLAIAHAHGVQIGPMHRAGDDVTCLASLLERCAELGHDVQRMLERAMRPKSKYVVVEQGRFPWDQKRLLNEQYKKAGFRWDGESGVWWRRLVPEDVPSLALPFDVREVA